MAEFCAQCAAEHGGHSDFKGVQPYEVVLCEGCGPIQVDRKGNCLSSDCLKWHGAPLDKRSDE